MFKIKLKSSKITAVGSALIDFLIHETDDFLLDLNKEKGGMTLVQDSYIQDILKRAPERNKDNKPIIVPGGAACNTIIGVGKLGGKAGFIGTRGDDYHGKFYEDNLIKSNVEPIFQTSSTPTGKVLSIITPDAQRSMFTYLGASTELKPDSITPEMFQDSGIALMEGYLLFNPDLMTACLKSAKQAGAMIALDLASFEVVNSSKNILGSIIKDYIDILIANEDEAEAYTGFSDELKAVEALSENVMIGVLKIGSRGSYVSYNDKSLLDKDETVSKPKIIRIHAESGEKPKDTTGAGDLWAAGFLYGIANGYSLEKSGEIASCCGYEVCQVIGAQIPEDGWKRIFNLLT